MYSYIPKQAQVRIRFTYLSFSPAKGKKHLIRLPLEGMETTEYRITGSLNSSGNMKKKERWYFRNRPFHRWKNGIAHLQHPEKGRCCKNATLIFRLSSGRRLHLSYPLWREMQTKCIRLFKIVKLGSCQHIDSRCCFTFENQLKVKKKMTSITLS